MNTSGERIRYARNNAGLTQNELGGACGVSRAAVTQWENGSSKSLRPENLFAVAKATKTNAQWLATGKGSPYDSITENAHQKSTISANNSGLSINEQAGSYRASPNNSDAAILLADKILKMDALNQIPENVLSSIDLILDAIVATSSKEQ